MAASPRNERLEPRQTAIDHGRVAEWRCFHCDFVTSDRDEAELHFGRKSFYDPMCKMTDAGQRREYITLDASYSKVCAQRILLFEALQEIATAKPEPVTEDFVQGPAALWGWAQRRAKEAMKAIRALSATAEVTGSACEAAPDVEVGPGKTP